MARRNTVVRDVTLNQPDSIVFTDAERKSEFLKVAIRITNRPDQVGTFNLEPTIPRKWSGWFWVVHKNVVVDAGAVQFENQLLLRSQLTWIFEQAVNTYSIEATTPDADANELVDENAVLNYYSNEQDPDNYYLPFPHPYDEIKVWFPSGVTANVIVEHTPWSPISVFGEDNDLDVTQFIQEREELTQPSLGTNTALPLFDVCEAAFPDNFVPDPPRKIRITYKAPRLSDGVAIERSLAVIGESVGLVGTPITGFGTPPAVSHWASLSSFQPCENLTPVTPTPLNRNNSVHWALQLLEVDGVQAYVSQQVTSSFGAITIDLDSFTFEDCP